jgi:hypothetical protein
MAVATPVGGVLPHLALTSMATTLGMIGEGPMADTQGDGRDNHNRGIYTVDRVSLQTLVVVEVISLVRVHSMATLVHKWHGR